MAFDLFEEFEKMCKEDEEKARAEAAKKAGDNPPPNGDSEKKPEYSPEPEDKTPPAEKTPAEATPPAESEDN